MDAPTDPRRRSAPSALRNRGPILEVLELAVPAEGLALEVSSGTGEHVVYFAEHLPGLTWQPSDPDPEARESVAAWIDATGLRNVRPPIDLDVTWVEWPVDPVDVLVNINMIHIAPWAACEGLMRGAGRVLKPGGILLMYGPYRRGGAHTAPSNEAFDQSLRARNPAWGVRDLEAVVALAAEHGLEHQHTVTMPANNLTVVYRRVPR